MHLAVASNFTAAMKALQPVFESRSEHQLQLSFGSSGKFYAQILAGAPYHVFLSADQAKPVALEKAGVAVQGTRFSYALGGLALWSAQQNKELGPAFLRKGGFHKLALAHPTLAPYGQAAVEVLRGLGLEATTQSKWVRGENIAQTYQFVATGNADVGFVALAQLRGANAPPTGSVWVVPETLYSPIRQDAVLLRQGRDRRGAKQFLNFLRSPEARAVIESHGYSLPAP